MLCFCRAFEKLLASSKVAQTPPKKMLGGQQIRAFHALHREAHHQGLIMNIPPALQIQKFPGGYVQNPKPGLVIPHGDFHRVQTTLDFKSLYPSLMRQFGLDYCNFRAGSEEYSRLVDAYQVWQLTTTAKPIVEKVIVTAKAVDRCRFVHRVEQLQKNEERLQQLETEALNLLKTALAIAENRLKGHFLGTQAKANMVLFKKRQSIVVHEVDLPLHLACFRNEDGGILPSLIDRYMTERKRYKKLMKEAYKNYQKSETEEEKTNYLSQHAQYDSAQLAVKIMVNSLFGFTGVPADKAMFALNIIAATTTCAGRWVIKVTAELSQSHHLLHMNGTSFEFFINKKQFLKAIEIHESDSSSPVPIFTEMIYGDTDSIMPSIEFKNPASSRTVNALRR